MLAMPEVIYHKDRILHPMKRAFEDRGLDKWEQITWDEAYDMIEAKVREIWAEYGPQSIFTLTGTGRESTLYAPVYGPAVLNTPNGQSTCVLSGEACYSPRSTVVNYILGSGYPELDYAAFFPDRYDDPRYEVPKYILVWGKDPLHSNPDGLFGHALTDLMKRGSKLIVVDPRLTWIAAKADYHIQLRPGTDAAVGLGMVNVIISDGLYNHDFVEKWCYGFDKLAERAAEWTPERVAEVAWIDKDILVEATRAFAANGPSSALWGLAIDQMKNGIQAGQVFLAILAICGYLDIPGGVTLMRPVSFIGKWRYEMGSALDEDLKPYRIRTTEDKYQMFDSGGAMPAVQSDTLLNYLELPEEQKPYPLKMSWWIGTNPIACMGAVPRRWLEALGKVEFTVVNDIFMTPSIMALADLVLPLCTSPEHEGIVMPHFGRNTNFVGAMKKVLDAGDTKSDLEILIDMGKRLRPELWDGYDNVADFFDKQLRTVYDWGYDDLKEEVVHMNEFSYRKYETGGLRNDGTPGFETPTGKIELRSTIYKMFGEDALPYFEEPDYSPYSQPEEVAKEFPIVYTTGGRNITMFHSEHRQIPSLRAINPWPLVTINPQTAEENGIHDGDWVAIESPLGRCVQKARVSKEVQPWLIHMEHAWWYPEQDGEAPNLFGVFKSNANDLMPHESVGKTGYGAPYKNGICKIYRVDSLEA